MAQRPAEVGPFLRVFGLVTQLAADTKKVLQASAGAPPNGPPVAPTSNEEENSPMEARVTKLETAVEYISRDLKEIKDEVREIKRDARVDFRLLFGAIIALGLGMAGLMAKGFHWL